MVLTSYIIFILWFFSKGIWKDRISYYFIVFGVCSQYLFNLIYPFGTTELLKVVILAVTVLYVLHKRSWSMFNLISLVPLIYAINRFTHGLTIPNHETIAILTLVAVLIIFKFAGELLSKDLYIMKKREFTFIDFYFPAALLMYPIIWEHARNMSLIYRLIPGLLLIYLLSSQVKRVSDNLIKSIILSFIVGMQYRIRCYFFVGILALTFNILIQTKPFWGSLPWWAYLIISGFILIGLASFNEWQKKNEKKLLKDKLDKFKDWL